MVSTDVFLNFCVPFRLTQASYGEDSGGREIGDIDVSVQRRVRYSMCMYHRGDTVLIVNTIIGIKKQAGLL